MPHSIKKVKEIVAFCKEYGEKETLSTYQISILTLTKIKHQFIQEFKYDPFKANDLLAKMKSVYSDEELKAIAKGGRIVPGQTKVPIIVFNGEKVTFAFFTDTHMGSIYFQEKYFNQALEECEKENVKFICHAGDLCDGLSHRPGHVYELTHIGYNAQKEYAIQQLKKWNKPWFIISGNHDGFFKKSNGAMIVQDICDQVEQAKYLGEHRGDITLQGNCLIRLWHGEDSSSYSVSYRLQKLAEAIVGGDKPHILLCGHTHKQGYFFERHIHIVSGGALCLQSAWMQNKRLANHTGFWIITAWINKEGVSKFQSTWYPFYS